MPDPFQNARPYLDVSFPNSGDGFSLAGFRNCHNALGFMDMIPLQPRAHSPADLKIMVRGQDASQFFNPVYFGNADQRIPFNSGDTTAFSLPVSNPRVDIVYMTPSGDYRIAQGSEAASPTLPSLAPSGDSRFPIAAIFCKPGMTKVVNFEDKDSNSGDGYIYKDLRPWMRSAGAGAVGLSNVLPVNITGDNGLGSAAGAARADHRHQGVHTIRRIGSGDLYGDIEVFAPDATQSGNRLNIGQSLMPKAWGSLDARGGTMLNKGSYNIRSVTYDGSGLGTVNFTVPFSGPYSVLGGSNHNDATGNLFMAYNLLPGSFQFTTITSAGNVPTDSLIYFIAMGFQN